MGAASSYFEEALLWDPGDVLTSDHFKQYLPYPLVLEFCVFFNSLIACKREERGEGL